MARRADPERIFIARRVATRNVLTDEGMPPELAETWCHAWEVHAEELELDRLTSEYWTLGSAWIHEQRMRRKLPDEQ